MPRSSQTYQLSRPPVIVGYGSACTVQEDTTLAVSRDAYFTSDRIAVRATVRVAWGFITPAALVKINLDPIV